VTMLVTLAEAKLHLRIDEQDSAGNADDSDLTLKIHAASGAVLNYIRGSGETFLDSSGNPETDTAGDIVGVPYEVKAAVLLLLGDFYKEREALNAANWTQGFLPISVMSLLYPYRQPTIA
jgi:hypothetical protein